MRPSQRDLGETVMFVAQWLGGLLLWSVVVFGLDPAFSATVREAWLKASWWQVQQAMHFVEYIRLYLVPLVVQCLLVMGVVRFVMLLRIVIAVGYLQQVTVWSLVMKKEQKTMRREWSLWSRLVVLVAMKTK